VLLQVQIGSNLLQEGSAYKKGRIILIHVVNKTTEFKKYTFLRIESGNLSQPVFDQCIGFKIYLYFMH
jgi:hypothetical protein